MRYVRIPADETQKLGPEGPEGGAAPAPIVRTFASTLLEWLNTSVEQFGKGYDAIASGRKIEAAFVGKRPGDIVAIEDADYQRLLKAADETTYVPAIGRYLVPFVEALHDAKKEPPA